MLRRRRHRSSSSVRHLWHSTGYHTIHTYLTIPYLTLPNHNLLYHTSQAMSRLSPSHSILVVDATFAKSLYLLLVPFPSLFTSTSSLSSILTTKDPIGLFLKRMAFVGVSTSPYLLHHHQAPPAAARTPSTRPQTRAMFPPPQPGYWARVLSQDTERVITLLP